MDLSVKNYFITIGLLFWMVLSVKAQGSDDLWQKSLPYEPKSSQKDDHRLSPSKYDVYRLNLNLLKNKLKNVPKRYGVSSMKGGIFSFPNEDGVLEEFRVKESSIMQERLQEKFPNIRSYIGTGVDDPSTIVRFSIGPSGLHAMFLSNTKTARYIDPEASEEQSYMVYTRKNLPEATPFECLFDDYNSISNSKAKELSSKAVNANDGKLRKFRLAIATTGEYSQFHLADQGINAGASTEVKKEAVLDAIVTTMIRVNGIFERDMGLTMELVENNSEIIFLDAATDGFTNDDGSLLIDEGQNVISNVIGVDNYDIGHTFSTGGGGLAQINSPCTANKARAVTGSNTPKGDPYYIDFVAHEMGHQFGAHHSFNGESGSCAGNGNSGTAVEPGSGSTIMAYAGLCAPHNVMAESDVYFHLVSIREMWNNISNGNSDCAEAIITGNEAPVLPEIGDYTIPVGTPFVLKTVATDGNDDQMTYTWEQLDIESTSYPLVSTATQGPAFRSLRPTSSGARYFPDQNTVIAGDLSNTWEVIPTVSRTMRFGVTVRDNNIQGGQTNSEETVITFTDTAGPFKVTSQTSEVSWDAGTAQTVTWDVANTNSAPVNCNLVNIWMSLDNGYTYPIVIASNVVNDGFHEVVAPNITTELGRIKVESVDNVFYAMNEANISIQASEFIMEIDTANKKTCAPDDVNYSIDYKTFLDFNEETTFSAVGIPLGASAVFDPASATADNTPVTMTISGIQDESVENYSISIIGISASTTKSTVVSLEVFSSTVKSPNLTLPLDNTVGVLKPYTMNWESDVNALNYEIEISTENDFNTILETNAVNFNSYEPTSLLPNSVYYWRVKSINDCGESSFSSPFKLTTADEICDIHNSSDTPLNIPDNNSGGLNSIATVEETENKTISDVNITVNINHAWIEDISLVLISPQGIPVRLSTNIGSDGDNYTNTVFDNEASDHISSGIAPFTGSFRPQGDLTRFNGEESYGNWTLKVVDSEDLDLGSLLNWSLEICGVPINDNDNDRDGVANENDLCPNSLLGSTVDATGCSNFSLPSDNFSIEVVGETCTGKNNGQISINTLESHNYYIILDQVKYEFTSNLTITDLSPDIVYDICIFVTGESFEQCYELEVEEGPTISGNTVVSSNNLSVEMEAGTIPFEIFVNGNKVMETVDYTFNVPVNQGDLVEIKTAVSCEGTLSKKIELVDEVVVYPNPTKGIFNVALYTTKSEVSVELYNSLSQLVAVKTCPVTEGRILVNIEDKSTGIYFVKILLEEPAYFKIIKE